MDPNRYDDAGKHVGYGYAIYQGQALVATGKGAINTLSHVFDAEAIGALKGLQKALTLPSNADTQTMAILADAGAKSDIVDPGPTAQPTISGIGIDSTKPGSQRYKWMVAQNEPTLSGGIANGN
ncbi:hypothetical protein DID88_004603 [Monilinia fructigena]|uniref:Uncharacterized protein n=1 Tax=Monilinia fructigena TaxID=38457 RepID=A0A395IRJ7_9HELO|nr:hypothetical protein DID88_004603 [Monilinia fructigena]